MVVRSVAGCLEEQEVSQERLRQEVERYMAIAAEQERKGATSEYGAAYWTAKARQAEAQIPQARTAAQLKGLYRKIRKSPDQKSR